MRPSFTGPAALPQPDKLVSAPHRISLPSNNPINNVEGSSLKAPSRPRSVTILSPGIPTVIATPRDRGPVILQSNRSGDAIKVVAAPTSSTVLTYHPDERNRPLAFSVETSFTARDYHPCKTATRILNSQRTCISSNTTAANNAPSNGLFFTPRTRQFRETYSSTPDTAIIARTGYQARPAPILPSCPTNTYHVVPRSQIQYGLVPGTRHTILTTRQQFPPSEAVSVSSSTQFTMSRAETPRQQPHYVAAATCNGVTGPPLTGSRSSRQYGHHNGVLSSNSMRGNEDTRPTSISYRQRNYVGISSPGNTQHGRDVMGSSAETSGASSVTVIPSSHPVLYGSNLPSCYPGKLNSGAPVMARPRTPRHYAQSQAQQTSYQTTTASHWPLSARAAPSAVPTSNVSRSFLTPRLVKSTNHPGSPSIGMPASQVSQNVDNRSGRGVFNKIFESVKATFWINTSNNASNRQAGVQQHTLQQQQQIGGRVTPRHPSPPRPGPPSPQFEMPTSVTNVSSGYAPDEKSSASAQLETPFPLNGQTGPQSPRNPKMPGSWRAKEEPGHNRSAPVSPATTTALNSMSAITLEKPSRMKPPRLDLSSVTANNGYDGQPSEPSWPATPSTTPGFAEKEKDTPNEFREQQNPAQDSVRDLAHESSNLPRQSRDMPSRDVPLESQEMQSNGRPDKISVGRPLTGIEETTPTQCNHGFSHQPSHPTQPQYSRTSSQALLMSPAALSPVRRSGAKPIRFSWIVARALIKLLLQPAETFQLHGVPWPAWALQKVPTLGASPTSCRVQEMYKATIPCRDGPPLRVFVKRIPVGIWRKQWEAQNKWDGEFVTDGENFVMEAAALAFLEQYGRSLAPRLLGILELSGGSNSMPNRSRPLRNNVSAANYIETLDTYYR